MGLRWVGFLMGKRKILLFLKKKKQKDFCFLAGRWPKIFAATRL
jgi:hypothetical protein